jgi:glycosyltransferase involved in cell wall biosynthesis
MEKSNMKQSINRALVLSYNFPPILSPGVSRVLKFVKYLPKYGWEPYVLTPDNNKHKFLRYDHIDLEEEEINPNRIYRTKICNIDRFIYEFRLHKLIPEILPDYKLGWIPFAVREGKKIIENNNIDVIFQSVPPFSSLFAGFLLKRLTGRPWVVDLRDIWSLVNGLRKGYKKNVDLYLEWMLLKHADHIITVSKDWAEYLKNSNRYKMPITVIDNGYDSDDYKYLHTKNNGKFRLVYTGGFYSGTQDPNGFFSALSNLLDRSEIKKDKLEVRIATGNHAYINGVIRAYPLLKDTLTILPFVPRKESLKEQLNASVLVFVRGKNKESYGGCGVKLYEYLYAKRPILALTPGHSPSARVIRQCGAGRVIEPDDIPMIEESIMAYYEEYLKNGYVECKSDIKTISQYDRYWLTGSLVKVFNEVVSI